MRSFALPALHSAWYAASALVPLSAFSPLSFPLLLIVITVTLSILIRVLWQQVTECLLIRVKYQEFAFLTNQVAKYGVAATHLVVPVTLSGRWCLSLYQGHVVFRRSPTPAPLPSVPNDLE